MLTKNRTLKCCLLIAILLVLVLVLAAGSGRVEGKTITVDDDGGADYEKIQDAIDAAEEGDTIRVYEGTYYENVLMDKTLSLIGDGSANTIINGSESGDVVWITVDWCNVSGFAVQNGGDGHSDAGIKIESNHNRIFENNCSGNNDGISLENSNFNTINNNTCENNDDNGINTWLSDSNTFENNTCERNFCDIYLLRSDFNIVANNVCKNSRYGIDLGHSWSCTVSNNTCQGHYYGIKIDDSCYSNILYNTCFSNSLTGITLGDSHNNTIENNTVKENYHAITLRSSNHNEINNNICVNNILSNINLWGACNNTITNNTCEESNDGIEFYNSSYNIILNNIISKNEIGIYMRNGSKNNTAHYNNIHSNTDYGINATNNGNHIINATYNWWLTNSGPYHSAKNPEGEGDMVTDYVEFDPWIKKDRKPVITTTSITKVSEDEEYLVDYEAEDEDNDPLTWNLETSAKFLQIDSKSGLLNGTPHQKDVGTYWVNVTVSDGELIDSRNFTLTVIEVNEKPFIITSDITTAYEDERYSVYYEAVDEENDTLIWDIITNASFLDFNQTTKALSGTPRQNDVGRYWVDIGVSDGSLFDIHIFTLTVIEVNEKPDITTTDRNQAFEDEEYFVFYEADDEENDTLAWYLNTNASFLTINSTTRKLNGIPEQKDVGTYWVNVTVSDGELIDYHNFTLTVIEVNDLPELTITSPTNGSEVKGTITIKGTASDEDGIIKKVEISINGGEWVVVTGIDSWNYEWNSTMVKNGNYEIKVRAFDGENSPELVWNLTVKNEEDPGKPDENGEEEEAGFIPGFETVCLLAGILVGSLWQRRKKG